MNRRTATRRSAPTCARGSACRCTSTAPARPSGNLQAWAREVRYAEARRLPGLIATGHTATDQVETVLYRLAASPGRRALLGMRAQEGRVIRPLLEVTREETAAYCRERGLAWREDPTNESLDFARNRVRHQLLPALRALHPAAEANILRTLEILRDEAEVLDDLVTPEPDLDALGALPPALARLTITEMAGAPIGGRLADILALSRHGTQTLDLGGGLRAVAEYGRLRFDDGPSEPPRPAVLTGARQRRLRQRPTHLRGSRRRPARRRPARPDARGPPVASRRPDATTRARRQPRPAGPVHRPQGPARAARRGAGRGGGRRDRLGAGRRHRGPLRGRPGARPAALRCAGPRLPSLLQDEHIGEILVQADELQHRIKEMAAEVSRDYRGRDLLLIGVLKGAVFFLADLMRELDVPCEVDFMAVSSYGSSTDSSGVVRILKDLDAPLEGRNVLIVEDIVDSGLTLQYLMRTLEARNPASIEVCALLTKPERRKVDMPARYVGFEIPDKFAIGYGLDYDERYRNLPYVATLTGIAD